MAKRKYQKNPLLYHLGKLQGQSGQSLSLDISGKKEEERVVSFPLLSPGRQTPKTPTHSPQSSLLRPLTVPSLSIFKSWATRCFLSVSHSSYNEHHDCYNQKEKTIYILHFKILAGDVCFQDSSFRMHVYLPFNTKILWNDPINSNIGGTIYSRAEEQRRIPEIGLELWGFPRTEADGHGHMYWERRHEDTFLECDLAVYQL